MQIIDLKIDAFVGTEDAGEFLDGSSVLSMGGCDNLGGNEQTKRQHNQRPSKAHVEMPVTREV